MRILLVSHTCQSRTEGQPKAQELGRIEGVELRVLVPNRWQHYGKSRAPQPPENPSFDFVTGRVQWPWLKGAGFYAHWYPGLGRLLREFRPDVIDLWEEPWGLVSAHACFLRDRLLPATKIVSETEQNLLKTLPPPFETFRSYTLRRADFCVGRNEESLRVLAEKGWRGPSEVVPNAVDAELFCPLARDECRRELLAALHLPDDAFLAGYVGRLVPEKGLADIVDALPACAPNVHAVLVGSGAMQDELVERAKAKGVAERVHFPGARPLTELPRLMNAFDVLLLPSRTTPRWKEQFGRVLIEAGACKTPVIGSDSGAIPDVIGEAGLVVPEANAPALARAIEQLRLDPAAARRMGESGRRQVEASYTWTRVAERMHAIYERVLAQR